MEDYSSSGIYSPGSEVSMTQSASAEKLEYGSTVSLAGSSEDGSVMTERVQSLASSIYSEFERMIKKYDEDVVKELMPLVVGVLEALDHAFKDKDELNVEMELIKDDNEQLLNQYEREKQLRKVSDQKFLAMEDAHEEERKEAETKVESLESIARMMELKAKNATDHVSRLEDKEVELKREYEKAHNRYTELFRTHMDYMERVKVQMGGFDRVAEQQSSSPKARPGSLQVNLRPVANSPGSPQPPSQPETPADGPTRRLGEGVSTDAATLRSELEADRQRNTSECADVQVEAKVDSREQAIGDSETPPRPSEGGASDVMDPEDDPSLDIAYAPAAASPPDYSSPSRVGLHQHTMYHEAEMEFDDRDFEVTGEWEQGMRARLDDMVQQTPELEYERQLATSTRIQDSPEEESLFAELAQEDAAALGEMDLGPDLTGMSREVENLIMENNELISTKNALNIVKDDLIARVDELTSELEATRSEVVSLHAARGRLKDRVAELEEELKKSRDELSKDKSKTGDDDEGVPMSQRKRFTRMEMARVLMERNQYKERLMELQEAVRWTEMIRASKEHPDVKTKETPKKKAGMWNFFSNLVGTGGEEKPPTPETPTRRKASGSATVI